MATINLIAGTGWPPSSAANTCVSQVFSDVGGWINATSSLDVKVTWENIGSNIAASSGPYAGDTNYSTIKNLLNALTDSSSNNIKSTAYGALPVSDPSPNATYKRRTLWNAVLNNINFSNQVGIYNTIQLNSTTYTYDTDQHGTSCANGDYGMYQAVLHELTELLGRFSELPSTATTGIDLFSYSAANTRSFSASGRYFAWDATGATNLGTYGSTGDYCDFVSGQTGAGYVGTSTASPFGTGAISDPQLIRYKDGQLLACLLPLTQQGLIVAGLPTNSAAPTISGTTTQGQTLTANAGTWAGQSSIALTYQWQRNGSNIGGATNSTYILVGADVGTTITVVETATNIIGAPTATSAGVGPVIGPTLVFTFGLRR